MSLPTSVVVASRRSLLFEAARAWAETHAILFLDRESTRPEEFRTVLDLYAYELVTIIRDGVRWTPEQVASALVSNTA